MNDENFKYWLKGFLEGRVALVEKDINLVLQRIPEPLVKIPTCTGGHTLNSLNIIGSTSPDIRGNSTTTYTYKDQPSTLTK